MSALPLDLEIARFLPPGMPVTSLPTGDRPRLFVAASSPLDRWRASALFPAFRLPAKVRRQLLRLAGAADMLTTRRVPEHGAELADFLLPHLTGDTARSLLLGTEGPAQKIVVQFWRGDEVVGYLKYAQKPMALKRLERERTVLVQLPAGVGPRLLCHGPLFDGQALLLEPVPGRPLRATERPTAEASGLLDGLPNGESHDAADHPWLRALAVACGPAPAAGSAPPLERHLAALADRPWPTTFQHGDFAPWNLISSPAAPLRAIDWEYAEPHGFPHCDVVHFILQVALLVHRLDPATAVNRAVAHLTATTGLTTRSADAIVRLTALRAYLDNERDGVPSRAPLQVARWSIAIGDG